MAVKSYGYGYGYKPQLVGSLGMYQGIRGNQGILRRGSAGIRGSYGYKPQLVGSLGRKQGILRESGDPAGTKHQTRAGTLDWPRYRYPVRGWSLLPPSDHLPTAFRPPSGGIRGSCGYQPSWHLGLAAVRGWSLPTTFRPPSYRPREESGDLAEAPGV
jgi:hypothetical protein